MRHADLIGIGKAHAKAQIDAVPVLDNRAPFAADIACRLLHAWEYSFELSRELHISTSSIIRHFLSR